MSPTKKKPKLNKKLNEFIIDKHYGAEPKAVVKPLVKTGGTLNSKPTLFQLAEQQHTQGLYDDFPVAPIDATISTAKKARQVFDKVIYPLKTIVGGKYKKVTGVKDIQDLQR